MAHRVNYNTVRIVIHAQDEKSLPAEAKSILFSYKLYTCKVFCESMAPETSSRRALKTAAGRGSPSGSCRFRCAVDLEWQSVVGPLTAGRKKRFPKPKGIGILGSIYVCEGESFVHLSAEQQQPVDHIHAGRPRCEKAHGSVLDAASELLNERGYSALTIEGIAAKAGVGKQTIYRWWPNKAAILTEIYERDGSKLHATPDLGSIEAEITELLGNIWAFWRETASGRAFRSVIAEAQADPAVLAHLRDVFIPKRRVHWLIVLKRAQERGDLRPDADLDLFLDIVFGFNWHRLLTDQPPSPHEIAGVVKMLLGGLRADRP